MNIYGAFSLFSLIILIYWIISEMFTILFRFTGLPDERARFQVTSLLTGCGFTTRESEIFISSPARRRLARLTMLFGYVFNITIVSSFINIFVSFKGERLNHYFIGMLIPLASLCLIFLIIRFPMMREWTDSMLSALADKIMRRKSINTVLLLDYIGEDSIAQVTLREIPPEYDGVPLAETNLKSELNILVMLTEHPEEKAVPGTADTIFRQGDRLTLFGNYTAICRAFNAGESFED